LENRLIELIDQLEEIFDQGTKVPLTGKVMIDHEVIIEILDAIRSVLPEEIRQANLVLSDRERLMDSARIESQRIVDRAEKQAEQLLKEDEIALQSHAYAEDLVQKAQQYSREVKYGALKYSDEILGDLALKLEENLKTIKSSREELDVMARRDERTQNGLDD